ncbi:MAG: hypothetical protein ACXAC7_19385 [Candidatus Hodarchaeales archaeon]|jgi:hypothetical protein
MKFDKSEFVFPIQYSFEMFCEKIENWKMNSIEGKNYKIKTNFSPPIQFKIQKGGIMTSPIIFEFFPTGKELPGKNLLEIHVDAYILTYALIIPKPLPIEHDSKLKERREGWRDFMSLMNFLEVTGGNLPQEEMQTFKQQLHEKINQIEKEFIEKIEILNQLQNSITKFKLQLFKVNNEKQIAKEIIQLKLIQNKIADIKIKLIKDPQILDKIQKQYSKSKTMLDKLKNESEETLLHYYQAQDRILKQTTQNRRTETLKILTTKVKRMSIQKMAERLEFHKPNELEDYILSLPLDSPFKIDGNDVIIDIQSNEEHKINEEIDKLINSLSESDKE